MKLPLFEKLVTAVVESPDVDGRVIRRFVEVVHVAEEPVRTLVVKLDEPRAAIFLC